MAKITMEAYEEFPTLPADSIVHLKVVETRVREVQGQRGSWEKLEFKFKILGIQIAGDGTPVENYEALLGSQIWGSVSYRFTDSPENRLKQWAEAIFGMELGVGFELDTDMFEGKQVRGVTSLYDKRAVNPRTGEKFKGHQIDSLLPFGGTVQGQGGWTQPAAPVDPWATPQAAPQPAPQPAQPALPTQPAQAPAQAQPVAAGAPAAGAGGNYWTDEPPF